MPFLPQFYRSHRATLFRFLEAVPLHSSTQDKTLEATIGFIKAHRNSRKPLLQNLDPVTNEPLDLKWIPKKWWSLVTGQPGRSPSPTVIHRQPFELCVFSHILLELKSGDLYIEGSYEYGDYYQQLISWEEYDTNISEYGDLLNFPVEPNQFASHVREWLGNTAKKTDEAFPANSEVSYKNERVVIRRRRKQYPPGLDELKSLIAKSFHCFIQWLSFGGNSIIATNNREEQRKFLKYNHLVANCLIFYNVFEVSRILWELVQEGHQVEPEAVAALSPYQRHHINRFGRYSLDVNRTPPKLNYDMTVFSVESQKAEIES